jgi:hypothetical protein
MTNSRKANRYGTLAEKKLAEKYRLSREGEHTSWCDAVDADGRPWELKAAMVERADGSTGRFRVFREPHRRLARANGMYGFAAYRVRGRGITVLQTRAVPASDLPGSAWYGAGGHRSSEQRKIAVEDVF